MRAVVDDHVDRPQVGALRDVEPSGTNGPEGLPGRTIQMSAGALRKMATRRGSNADKTVPLSFPVHAGRHTAVSRGRDKWRSCAGAHLFPSRTEKLSPAAAMILRASVEK